MTSHALYSLHHMNYIWQLICSVWCHIHYVCYITQWLYLWHQTQYVYDIFTLYGITHSVITSQPLCAFTATMPDITLSVFWHYTQCTNVMKRSVCMSSQPLYVWHHMHYIWHHIHSLWHHTTLFMTSSPLYLTSHPLYLTSHPLYLCNHTHSLSDIIATLCMISRTVYMWHPIHYLWHHFHYVWQHNTVCCWYHTRHMCDIIFTTDDITSTLSHQTTVFTISHPLQAWHHTHCIRHRTHCIFVITNSPLISYPLLYDIIPTICVTSDALYITSYQLLKSSHYCTYHITASIYETTSSM